MRYDDIPDVCRADLNSGRDYCNLFRLDVDGNTSRWNFDNFDNAVDVLFITDRSAYRIEDGIHYYSIRAKFVDGRQVSGVSGTCATDTPDFYSAACRQSNGETYLYDY
ncbi:hypothetical protein IQ241_24265 [Romeria aff. gracilis LEGE 07310]|uniref:Uncharacterized protein n=1 Tax=Vasconcelosia minhoensis LEGE 07310 TaxID=915328 RepID=A0A8J7AC76_9CYAN|nr:hypothetical protein [Romeria gracilis]MBE9080365.1 hypothetical protein [Romeria aff. gracilis LEGE 07310]